MQQTLQHTLQHTVRPTLQQTLQQTVRSLYKRVRTSHLDITPEAAQSAHIAIHWVVPGCLAIGSLPKSGASSTLTAAGIKAVLSLCAPAEGQLPEDVAQTFRCQRFILPDSQFISGLKIEQLAAVVNLIHTSIRQNEPVYVHCLAGIERSPTACIAYLCRHHSLELWEAINCLKQAHARSMPTDTQIQVIREFLKTC